MKNVLIVEDDIDILSLIHLHLMDMDCTVTKSMNGKHGLQLAIDKGFDLIILDITLPDLDGLSICRHLRAHDDFTPLLMLTAKADEFDKVLGLESGADDYLTKPFGIREFIARVKALLRRTERFTNASKAIAASIQTGQIEIDIPMRKVNVSGARVELTPKEFDLLVLLARNPGRSYSRAELLHTVWGYEFMGYEHTVNSHINRLRAKIEPKEPTPQYILTTWGVGYRFNDQI